MPERGSMRRDRVALQASLLAVLTAVPVAAAVQAPVLKWQRGGCFGSWCQTGWYSSPAVADLDGTGSPRSSGAPTTSWPSMAPTAR